jgi:hypothetical protein
MATVFEEVLEPSRLTELLALPRDAFFLSIQKGDKWPRVGPSSYTTLIRHASEMPVLKLRWTPALPAPADPGQPNNSGKIVPSAPSAGPLASPEDKRINFAVEKMDGSLTHFLMRTTLPISKVYDALESSFGYEQVDFDLKTRRGQSTRFAKYLTLEDYAIKANDVLDMQ